MDASAHSFLSQAHTEAGAEMATAPTDTVVRFFSFLKIDVVVIGHIIFFFGLIHIVAYLLFRE